MSVRCRGSIGHRCHSLLLRAVDDPPLRRRNRTMVSPPLAYHSPVSGRSCMRASSFPLLRPSSAAHGCRAVRARVQVADVQSPQGRQRAAGAAEPRCHARGAFASGDLQASAPGTPSAGRPGPRTSVALDRVVLSLLGADDESQQTRDPLIRRYVAWRNRHATTSDLQVS